MFGFFFDCHADTLSCVFSELNNLQPFNMKLLKFLLSWQAQSLYRSLGLYYNDFSVVFHELRILPLVCVSNSQEI